MQKNTANATTFLSSTDALCEKLAKLSANECSIQTEIRVVDCMVRASARQNFDGDAVASSRNFNDAMVRNRWFTMLISDRMEH